MCYDSLLIFSRISCDFSQKVFSTHHSLRLFDLCFKFPLHRLLGIETKRRVDFRRCSLVKEGRQSYSVALHDVLAMKISNMPKKLVGKRIAL